MSVRSVSDHAGEVRLALANCNPVGAWIILLYEISDNPSLLKSPTIDLGCVDPWSGKSGLDVENGPEISLDHLSPAFRQVPSRYPVSGRNDDILIPEWISVAPSPFQYQKLPCLQISLPMIQSLG